ncbi:non-canonical purine NTP pyrophosphatase, RdgB/HAM1 family [Psittacicella hinzii]|uniref:dITP/XTP pyrophosphatase n=1 Tax=Psittacicella hinzii TaxID=2028575 RepID=A0A3A1Y4Y9_9GAMM|nr:RdgB/HAM1 family non-canonical purine NTP pyrophosphatase [Psittacicella hinzii]RIY31227.1 non-canonical purine NTP pyrophosphatase, RdgB/HAM1 family [Psittacicella hinzii]
MSKTIVLATSNQGKLAEFKELFASVTAEQEVDLKSFADFPELKGAPEPVEDACSFIGNALIKAYHGAALTGLPTLADDSGLCVDALNSAPGVYSARFAQQENFTQPGLGKEALNYTCLLEKMAGINDEQRQAHFYCCLVLVRFPNDPEPLIAVGKCHGSITRQALGEHGHGYDPVFFSTDLGKTFAQANMLEKNQVSHRTLAFKDLISRGLKDFLS